MLLTDFVKLNLVDRASELIENHDLDNDAFNYLMNKGNNKRYNFIKLEPLYFYELSDSEQDDLMDQLNNYCDCGWCEQCLNNECDIENIKNDDYFKMGEIVYSMGECLRSDSFLGVWPISDNSALGLIYMNDDCAIVTYL